jgi:hypothetical protein
MQRLKALFLVLFLPLLSQAQTFVQGNVMVTGGAQLGIHQVVSSDEFRGTRRLGGTVSRILPFGIEVAATDYLGICIHYRKNIYVSTRDSVDADNREWSFGANVHFLRTQLTNVFVGLHGGPSRFRYTELTDLDEFEAKGLHLALVGGANMYFSNRFGLQFSAAFNNLIYRDGTVKEKSGNTTEYDLYLTGMTLGLSLVFII